MRSEIWAECERAKESAMIKNVAKGSELPTFLASRRSRAISYKKRNAHLFSFHTLSPPPASAQLLCDYYVYVLILMCALAIT